MRRGCRPWSFPAVAAGVSLALGATAPLADHLPPAPAVWCGGSEGTADSGGAVLCVNAEFGYSLSVGGEVWLRSAPGAALSFWCDGERLSARNGTLAPAGPASNVSGADTLGEWAGVQRRFVGPASAPHCAATATVLHYPAAGAFEFRLAFEAALNGTAAMDLPLSHSQLTTVSGGPTATAFPSFDARASGPSLGFVEFRGQTLSTGFVASAASGFPDGYQGGLQSGPLALFSASDPHPAALVVGPISAAKDTVLTLHDGALSAGASGYLESLPAGFQTRVALVARRGLNAAYSAWGRSARLAAGQVPKLTLDADPLSRQLHYLTDNGAFYCCYNCREPMHQTLAKLKDYHRSLGLNVSLYHQDRTLSHLSTRRAFSDRQTRGIVQRSGGRTLRTDTARTAAPPQPTTPRLISTTRKGWRRRAWTSSCSFR